MAIHFSSQISNFELSEPERIKKWIKEVVVRQNFAVGNIGYLFCDDEYILEKNISFLDHNTYTDIITFDYVQGGLISGDILISVDRVRENAEQFGVTFEQELHRVIIHGILHLLGNGDKTDEEAKAMRAKENEALALLETIEG